LGRDVQKRAGVHRIPPVHDRARPHRRDGASESGHPHLGILVGDAPFDREPLVHRHGPVQAVFPVQTVAAEARPYEPSSIAEILRQRFVAGS
jgi:hypothetical protein